VRTVVHELVASDAVKKELQDNIFVLILYICSLF
jgi:hypothetical protein